jgi:hypothetical protein
MTPVDDMMKAKEYLFNYFYESEGAIFIMRGDLHRFLVNWLINTKGASIPVWSSELASGQGVVMRIVGLKVVVSNIVTTDKAVIFVPQRAVTWKDFSNITSARIEEVGIGTKLRCWREGEAILTDPKAVVFFSNIGPT